MKLSLVFELLLIFVLLAFAASKSTRKQKNNNKKGIQNRNDAEKPEDNSINKYCKCTDALCNCCRDFDLPVVNLNGPGCASLMYLSGDKMSVSLSFGKKVITNRTLSSRKPSPVCMPLPGGVSKFCGRVYNIARSGEEFRACLGLELQAKRNVEAAVRVSCFKFGPRGVVSEPADPLPLVPQNEKDDDDDDDDDDVFGLGSDDDEDDDDDDDEDDDDATNDVDTTDYTGFSLLSGDILGDLFGSSGTKKSNKNKKKQAPISTTPSTTTVTTKRPRPSRRPTRRPARTTTPRTVASKVTTVKVRPGSRRPTRKPGRRPQRKPTTPITPESTSPSTLLTTSTQAVSVEISSSSLSTERNEMLSTFNDQTYQPIVIVTQKPESTIAVSTQKSVTNFEDPGLEMSLAHITGQLSAMPVTPMGQNTAKESDVTMSKDQMNYEKIETITKVPSTVPLVTPVEDSDEMVKIVQTLDSHSEEHEASKEDVRGDESRHFVSSHETNDFKIEKQKKKHNNNFFRMDDLDVLNLDEVGQSVGQQLGIFGKNKKQHKNNKVRGGKKDGDDYDVLGLETLESLVGVDRGNKNKKNRRRQNKMMRGEWSQV